MMSKKNKLGFTLIELLMVMAIIIIMSIIVVTRHHGSKENLEVKMSANKLAQDLRRVEEMAMSNMKPPVYPIPDAFNGTYGIVFNEGINGYKLFADLNNNNDCDLSDWQESTSLTSESIIVYDLDPLNPLVILFTPPDPTITIPGSSSEALITIRSNINLQEKTIKINEAGLIETY